MPCTILALIYRKAGITPMDFKEQYEDAVLPHIKKEMGRHFPLTYTRHYIGRFHYWPDGPVEPEAKGAATVDYDLIAELTFEDRTEVDSFMNRWMSKSLAHRYNVEKIAKVEEKVVDRAKTTVVYVDFPGPYVDGIRAKPATANAPAV
ncbi:hypothetical protein QBC46DRAFT_267604 [Diplogelasinospora grovesii]|uniref:EthD domain-containing protein n=1 Tax=Diplogelasinospora grovesii TaxID=303347 RepID=A0AAN6N4T6_9PEZI|nr:hypothetical protein QBC46DRAFT_267604 [Diplogelasinospora grovesii]